MVYTVTTSCDKHTNIIHLPLYRERLTIAECLAHPWIKNAIKRGQGLKIDVTNHKALTDRYRTMVSITESR